MVQITLKNDKVYVGWITSNFHPSMERKFIEILPVYSGYRQKTDMSIKFTTNYAKIYDKLETDKQIELVNKEDFGKVLPVSEIVSVNIFDLSVFELFNED